MARRQSRLTRGGSEATFKPSGVSISGTGIDYGQGTKYVMFQGVAGMNNISAGTREVVTGLTSIQSFVGQWEIGYGSGASKLVSFPIINITGGTVRLGIFVAATGVSVSNNMSGASLHWSAIGTR